MLEEGAVSYGAVGSRSLGDLVLGLKVGFCVRAVYAFTC